VDETVLLDAADGDLDDPVAVFADDRFLGDDVGDVLADPLPHLVAVAGGGPAPPAARRGGGGGAPPAPRRPSASVFPEIIGGVLEDHVDAIRAVAVVDQVLHHHVVLVGLFFVAGARLGDDAADVAYPRHQALLDRLTQRLIALVRDANVAPAGGPQIGDDFLAESLRRRTDDGDLFLDRLQKALVRLQLF